MIVHNFSRGINNLERGAGTAVLEFSAEVSNDRGETTLIQDGDFIYLGSVPANCMVTSCIFDVIDDFTDVVGETLEVYHTDYDHVTGQFTQLVLMDTVDLNVWEPKYVKLPFVPKNSDGSDGAPILPTGSGDVGIAVIANLTAPLKASGKGRLIFSYNYFGTKTSGGYIA